MRTGRLRRPIVAEPAQSVHFAYSSDSTASCRAQSVRVSGTSACQTGWAGPVDGADNDQSSAFNPVM
jgi:hypothetical protein